MRTESRSDALAIKNIPGNPFRARSTLVRSYSLAPTGNLSGFRQVCTKLPSLLKPFVKFAKAISGFTSRSLSKQPLVDTYKRYITNFRGRGFHGPASPKD